MRLRSEKGTYGRAGPFEMSTMILLWPISTLLKFKPELFSRLSRWNSGSSGCSRATSFQSMPKSPIDATTCFKSSIEAFFFDEHVDAATAADAVEDAEATVEGDVEG